MQTGHEFIPHDTEGMYKHLCLIYYPGSKETTNISRLCNSNQLCKFQAEDLLLPMFLSAHLQEVERVRSCKFRPICSGQ